MSWGEIFFGFRGRVNRKTYWAAGIAVALAGLAFNALLAYLATGNPFAPEVWQRPADKAAIWAPVWLAYFAFLVWPSTALAVKRLHDHGRGPRLWYVYYVVSLIVAVIPLRQTADGEPILLSQLLLLPFTLFAIYVSFELGVLRGTRGPNRYGEDTIPPGYYGGDYSFMSWMFAIEGRISRAKWWLGVLILSGALIAASFVLYLMSDAFMGQHPEIAANISNPDWLKSPQAAPLLTKLTLLSIPAALIFVLALWSLIALGVKRLHDRGLSSWLILVVVLPFAALPFTPQIAMAFDLGEGPVRLALLLFLASVIWSILQFGILKGETGPNRHGPDPLAG